MKVSYETNTDFEPIPREEQEFMNGLRDSRITFDEPSHTYQVDGKLIKWSVTQFIHHFFEEFDSKNICRKMIGGKYFMTKPEHDKYKKLPIWVHKDTGDVLSEWNENAILLSDRNKVIEIISNSWKDSGREASQLGTLMHANIEQFLLGNEVKDDSPEFDYFILYNKKMKSLGYIPYRMEMRVYDEQISIAGSIDMLWVRNDKKEQTPLHISVCDWKRSKEIKMNGYGNGKGACSDIPDCNFYHYSLQLNMYKYILEKHYNIIVDDMTLVVLHNINSTYIEVPVSNMQDKIKDMIGGLSAPKH